MCRKRSGNLLAILAVLAVGAMIVRIFQTDKLYRAAAKQERELAVWKSHGQRHCWVFNHMNKAGGSTVKYMLKPWLTTNNVTLGLYDSKEWVKGKRFADKFVGQANTLTWGAYTEGIRPYGAAECKWFTIFRHPIPRLVSAYFYCKKSPYDGLCGSMIVKADEVDLVTFAEHWGNFGLRQFALGFKLPEDVIASEPDDRCKGDTKARRCPGWYRLKKYLERLHQAYLSENSQAEFKDLKDLAMYELLKPVQELLTNNYTAVGILEEWDSSMLLFNAALKLPGYDWRKAYRDVGKKNGDHSFIHEEREALLTAWTNTEVKRYIWLDLLLYEHAVSVHARQLAKHAVV